MRLINGDALYEQLKQDEEMARNRVLDTDLSLPYPNNLNPSYTRYVTQMNERTRLKNMVADAPTIEERKTGKWIRCDTDGFRNMLKCPECGAMIDIHEEFRSLFCYHCGMKMIGVQN